MTIMIYLKFIFTFCNILVHVFSIYLRFFQAGLRSTTRTTTNILCIFSVLYQYDYCNFADDLCDSLEELLQRNRFAGAAEEAT